MPGSAPNRAAEQLVLPNQAFPTDETGQGLLFDKPEEVSIEELARQVAAERTKNVATKAVQASAQEQPQPAGRRASYRGGAFGGALKRQIEQTDSAEKFAATNQRDIELLAPLSIQRELFTSWGDQSYRGVVLTPGEQGAITYSADTFSRRVGSRVLSGTVGRPASDRHARKHEIVMNGLQNQATKADAAMATLSSDLDTLQALAKEMKSPGYSHMAGQEMDRKMAHARRIFISMFEAITTNHGAGTERVESLTAALEFLLTNSDYKKTFGYWRHMTNIGIDWTRAKLARFEEVKQDINQTITERV